MIIDEIFMSSALAWEHRSSQHPKAQGSWSLGITIIVMLHLEFSGLNSKQQELLLDKPWRPRSMHLSSTFVLCMLD
jgi:hypothetical protein